MSELKQLLASIKGKKILVIGDLMLDEYFYGEITRISPEAPVPIVRVSKRIKTLGGAANVANNVVALGGKAELLGVVGNDGNGVTLNGLAVLCRIGKSGIITDPSRPTTTKIRVLSNNKHILRVDEESDAPVSEAIRFEFMKKFREKLDGCAAVVISDYNKGVISGHFSNEIIGLANGKKIPVFIDSKNYLSYEMRNAGLLKPNLKELGKETGIDVSTGAGMEKAAKMLMETLKPRAILVTLGEKGMRLFEGKSVCNMAPIKVDAVDVSGAGDTVIATVALAYAAGGSFLDAAKLANYAAAAAVSKTGTVAPTPAEILAMIEESKGRK